MRVLSRETMARLLLPVATALFLSASPVKSEGPDSAVARSSELVRPLTTLQAARSLNRHPVQQIRQSSSTAHDTLCSDVRALFFPQRAKYRLDGLL
jgi:hypothetical protein